MIKPLSPAEAKKLAADRIPDEVIEVVNEMLAKQGYKNRIIILQKDIVNEILKKTERYSRAEIFDLGLLDFESRFEAVGWKIDFAKPGLHDDFEARFVFSPK